MHTIVKGVRIELTESQISKINEELLEREKCRDSFEKMLLKLKFTKETAEDGSNYFTHPYYNWYAQIQDFGGWSECFMAGQGLKHSTCPPGGWMYSKPEDVETEIIGAMERLQED